MRENAFAVRGKSWEKRSARMRDLIKMPIGLMPWSSGISRLGRVPPEYRGLPSNALRGRDVADVAWYRARQEAPAREPALTTMEDLYVNVSQNCDRVRARRQGPGALCRNSIIYSYKHDAVLSAAMHMKLMGWPEELLHNHSDHSLRDLAGDGVSLAAVACIEAASALPVRVLGVR